MKMNTILRKLLFENQNKLQLFLAFLASTIGVLFVILSISYLIKLSNWGEQSEVMRDDTLIIQKEIATATSFSLGSSFFTENEINAIRKEPCVKVVEPIQCNNFGVVIESNDPIIPYFRSDVFIQSVPLDFLDVQMADWEWNPSDSIVPIVLPRDFVVMLNTFMASSGMPQVSDVIIKAVTFRLTIASQQKSYAFRAKIIGFTNELSSILVPESFMDFGKKEVGNPRNEKVNQLMIASFKGKFGLLESFITKHHFETKKNQLVTARLKSVLMVMIFLVLVISVMVFCVSMLGLIQYFQLVIAINSYEIRTLLRLGFGLKQLVSPFVFFAFLFISIVVFFGLLSFYFINAYLTNVFLESGLVLEGESLTVLFTVIFVLFISIMYFSIATVRKSVLRQF